MSDSKFEAWIDEMGAGGTPELKPWEKLNLLEYVASRQGDLGEVAAALLDAPIPVFRLEEFLGAAAQTGNERVAILIADAGATALPLADACRAGLPDLTALLVARGARFNRRFATELAPLHLAVESGSAETVQVLVDACCDVTVRTPQGQFAWELGGGAFVELLRGSVGARGPTWFREAQIEDVDYFHFVREEAMFGFNPNDVQAPILTGNEDEGFGWANTVVQARAVLADNRHLASELEWFAPVLDMLEAGEDFGLSALGPRVPRRREPSWRSPRSS